MAQISLPQTQIKGKTARLTLQNGKKSAQLSERNTQIRFHCATLKLYTINMKETEKIWMAFYQLGKNLSTWCIQHNHLFLLTWNFAK